MRSAQSQYSYRHYFHDHPCSVPKNVRKLLRMGVTRFYLGHGGPVGARDVREALQRGEFECALRTGD